jgi:hypothetical protein
MKGKGWQNRPLWIAEYGVLGSFSQSKAQAFMRSSWDFMRTAKDTGTGYKPDNYRLVQRWAWFSGNCAQAVVPNAALYNGKSLSPYGQTWVNYWGAK